MSNALASAAAAAAPAAKINCAFCQVVSLGFVISLSLSTECPRNPTAATRLVPQHAVTMAATAGVGAGSTDTSSQISGSAALGSEELTEVKVGLAAPICDLPPHSPSCAQRVWALVDTDGSGSIDSTELRGMDVAHSVWCLEGAGGCHTLRLADASSDQA